MFQCARTGANPRQLCHHFHPQPYALRVTSSPYVINVPSQTVEPEFGRPRIPTTLWRRRDSILLRRTTSRDGFETNAFLTLYAGCDWLVSKSTTRGVIDVSQEKGSICFITGMINLKQRSFIFEVLDYWHRLWNGRSWLTGLVTLCMTHSVVSYSYKLHTSNSFLHSTISSLTGQKFVKSKR